VTGLRVGLHAGLLVAGTLGRGDHVEYRLLGDTANVSARLEQLGRQFAGADPCACTIVVGTPTWDRRGALSKASGLARLRCVAGRVNECLSH